MCFLVHYGAVHIKPAPGLQQATPLQHYQKPLLSSLINVQLGPEQVHIIESKNF